MIDPNGEIMRRLTAAMLPGKVCRTCGEPSRRIVEPTAEYRAAREKVRSGSYEAKGQDKAIGRVDGGNGDRWANSAAQDIDRLQRYTDRGFTDCGHDDWRPGTVLWIWWGDP